MITNILLGIHALFWFLAILQYVLLPESLQKIASLYTWQKLGFISLLILLYRLGV